MGKNSKVYGDYLYGVRLVSAYDSDPAYHYFENEDGRRSVNFGDAEEFSQGYALVKLQNEEGYRFLDTQFNLSEMYEDAASYSSGYAYVKRVGEESKRFRDLDGNLSNSFHEASTSYHDGFVCVQVNPNGGWAFRNEMGELSETFENVVSYHKGFAGVTINGTSFYRDMVGNVTDNLTESGKIFYKYWKGEIGVEDIPTEYFEDEKFYKGVIKNKAIELQQAASISNNVNGNGPSPEHLAELMNDVVRVANDKRNKSLEKYDNEFDYTK